MRHIVLILISVIGLVAPTSTAEAASAAGTWKSTSGNKFVIPESRTEFDVIKHAPNGTRELMRARWINGMVGTQFTYVWQGITCTATFNIRNPDTLRVVCGRETNVWTRIKGPKTGRGLVGLWRSTSGNQFTIPERTRGAFDIIVKFANGRKELYKARWIEGMEGTQFTYGNPAYTGTRNGQNRDQIRIVAPNGQVLIWYRMR